MSSHDSPILNDFSVMAREDDRFLEKTVHELFSFRDESTVEFLCGKIKCTIISSTLYNIWTL